ncbi:MAG: hypothetical protein JJU45_02490 [Acidimicrobiia bacterium]|nr:hypothetical protein [Acidimicrobiia bacterium]
MRRTIAPLAALLLLTAAACGDDDEQAQPPDDDLTAQEEALDDLTTPENGFDDDIEDFGDIDVPFEQEGGPDVDYDGPAELDLDFDELRTAVDEIFDGEDRGRGSNFWGSWSEIQVEVGEGSLDTEQLLNACNELVDWLFEQPEGSVVGPVRVEISERGPSGDLEDVNVLVVNNTIIATTDPGTCEAA